MVIDKEEQKTSIELEDQTKTNKINGELSLKKVRIKRIIKESLDPEDYYYLKKFENKIGTICEDTECESGVHTYKVEFDRNEFGYFYKDDFLLLNEDKTN